MSEDVSGRSNDWTDYSEGWKNHDHKRRQWWGRCFNEGTKPVESGFLGMGGRSARWRTWISIWKCFFPLFPLQSQLFFVSLHLLWIQNWKCKDNFRICLLISTDPSSGGILCKNMPCCFLLGKQLLCPKLHPILLGDAKVEVTHTAKKFRFADGGTDGTDAQLNFI